MLDLRRGLALIFGREHDGIPADAEALLDEAPKRGEKLPPERSCSAALWGPSPLPPLSLSPLSSSPVPVSNERLEAVTIPMAVSGEEVKMDPRRFVRFLLFFVWTKLTLAWATPTFLQLTVTVFRSLRCHVLFLLRISAVFGGISPNPCC